MFNTSVFLYGYKMSCYIELSVICGGITHTRNTMKTLTNNATETKIFETCENCTNDVNILGNNFQELDGDTYCQECYIELAKDCDDCGGTHNEENLIETANSTVCETCRDDNYLSCDKCEDIVENDDVQSLANGDVYCENCIDSYCDSCVGCSDILDTRLDDYLTSATGDTYCVDCADSYLYYCESCGEWSTNDDCCYSGFTQTFLDESSYDATRLGFFHTENDTFQLAYMGAEIEFSYNGNDGRNDAENVLQHLQTSHFTFVEDGSLIAGIEANSAPMTLDYWKNEMGENVENFYRYFTANNLTTDRAGLHIHINKAAILGIESMAALIYADKEFSDFVKFFSRRNNDYQWCRFDGVIGENHALGSWSEITLKDKETRTEHAKLWAKYDSENYNRELIDKAYGMGLQFQKYSAMNILPANTVEFRIWKTPTTASELWAALEFVDAMVTYGNNTVADNANAYGFYSFVADRQSRYPHLNATIEKYLTVTTIEKLNELQATNECYSVVKEIGKAIRERNELRIKRDDALKAIGQSRNSLMTLHQLSDDAIDLIADAAIDTASREQRNADNTAEAIAELRRIYGDDACICESCIAYTIRTMGR